MIPQPGAFVCVSICTWFSFLENRFLTAEDKAENENIRNSFFEFEEIAAEQHELSSS